MAEITDEWIDLQIRNSILLQEQYNSPCGCRGQYLCAYHEGMGDGLDMAQVRQREKPEYARPMKAGWPDNPIIIQDVGWRIEKQSDD